MTDKDKVMIHIDPAEKRPDLPEVQPGERCPHCGGETEDGFGLAGGGIGIYSYCASCGAIVSKTVISDEG